MKNLFTKVTKPILDQLKQGATPHKLALSVAFGLILGTIPVLGATTTLCIVAAFFFGLNHIAIQTINYIAYPLQLLLLIPFIRIGEWLFRKPMTPLNLTTILEQFQISIKIALEKYLYLGLMGMVAWALIAPVAFVIIYWISKATMEKLIKADRD
jgi:hypothetical protein